MINDGPGRVLWISRDGVVQRTFLGLKLTNFGILGVRRFWQVFFRVVCKNDL